MLTLKSNFILQLIKNGLISFSETTTSPQGHINPYYVDLRSIYSYPILFNFAVTWLVGSIKRLDDQGVVCGIETASLPLAGAYGYITNQPIVYLRTKPKPYGNQKTIEGHLPKNANLILIDDVIVEPEQTLPFITKAESTGAKVTRLVVLFEKFAPQLSRSVFERRGYPVTSLFTYEDLAEVIREHGTSLKLHPSLPELIYEFGTTDPSL